MLSLQCWPEPRKSWSLGAVNILLVLYEVSTRLDICIHSVLRHSLLTCYFLEANILRRDSQAYFLDSLLKLSDQGRMELVHMWFTFA